MGGIRGKWVLEFLHNMWLSVWGSLSSNCTLALKQTAIQSLDSLKIHEQQPVWSFLLIDTIICLHSFEFTDVKRRIKSCFSLCFSLSPRGGPAPKGVCELGDHCAYVVSLVSVKTKRWSFDGFAMGVEHSLRPSYGRGRKGEADKKTHI